MRWMPEASWHGSLQVFCDLVMISGLIYATGRRTATSSGCIRWRSSWPAFCFRARQRLSTAAACVAALAILTELVICGSLPQTSNSQPTLDNLRHVVSSNLFCFLAVAYLSSLLAQTPAAPGRGTDRKAGRTAGPAGFQRRHYSLHARRIADHRSGWPHPAAEPHRRRNYWDRHSASCAGSRLAGSVAEFWLPGKCHRGRRNSRSAGRLNFSRPGGQQRFLGISVSPLRTGSAAPPDTFSIFRTSRNWRLEQEVATKERMAALGRLSAAIAHEIRQPLTAMAGAVKELGRLVPLQEDEQHLVEIVSRESERLNKIITEFLNYSREKTYDFSRKRTSAAAGRDADAAGAQSAGRREIPHRAHFTGDRKCARAWTATASSRCSGICPTTRCAPCPTAEC